MSKYIDLSKTVYELCQDYPEVVDIMSDIGFKEITNAVAMNTVGRIMTIPKGAAIKEIPLPTVLDAFKARGFDIVETVPDASEAKDGSATSFVPTVETMTVDATATEEEKRAALLKSYIQRLSAGEDLATVRAEFVKHFSHVDASEIALAEQELIDSGTPVAEVQRLCDVHSALFHGTTREEQAVHEAVDNEAGSLTNAFVNIAGHPVQVLMAENEQIAMRIADVRAAQVAQDQTSLGGTIEALRAVAGHYAQKGDLIYPLLNRTYGFSGPSNVMWGVDDEIRDELRLLSEAGTALPNFDERLTQVVVRAEEMIYKENNILLPLCIQQFSEDDWMQIYYEMRAYDTVLPEGFPTWEAAEQQREALKIIGGKTAYAKDDASEPLSDQAPQTIAVGSGLMTPAQIEAVLNTIPMELTFVDENDINRFFSAGEKLFKRPDMAIGRDVYSCHPPKIEVMVRQIIADFKAGVKDSVDVWMNKAGEPVFVRYMAVRDAEGAYLGTLECVQKMAFAEAHFSK